MKKNEIRTYLLEHQEEAYCDFTSRLLPGTEHILGVRLPQLRKFAKQLVKENRAEKYIKDGEEFYFEEVMLKGMIIGYLKIELPKKLLLIEEFIPKIKNWSVCDSFCTGLKECKNHKEMVWDFLQPFFDSKEEFEVRFAVVMLLNYFVEEQWIDRVIDKLLVVCHKGYYAKMAVAWAISICYIHFPKKTFLCFKDHSLEKEVEKMAIQKICDSYRVSQEEKRKLRSM